MCTRVLARACKTTSGWAWFADRATTKIEFGISYWKKFPYHIYLANLPLQLMYSYLEIVCYNMTNALQLHLNILEMVLIFSFTALNLSFFEGFQMG